MTEKAQIKESFGKEDLKAKFETLNQSLEATNANAMKLQNALTQEQAKTQQILGAMQNTAEMLAQLIGQKEAQKVINEIQNPKKEEAKVNGKEN